MKILIVGGSGILSSAVVDLCISQGHFVTIINRGHRREFINSKAELIIGDIYDAEDIQTKIHGRSFDVVVDFLVFTPEQLKSSLQLFGEKTNQYVLISSAQVYNTSISKVHIESDETPQKLWKYSINKDICEKYLLSYCKKHGVTYTIVRPGVNYDNRRIPYGMYPPIGKHYTIVARILAGKPIITWNKGANKYNLTRVEDFAYGMVGLLGNKKAYNETFNVVGDNVYTWNQVLEVLGLLLDKQVETVDLSVEAYADELEGDDREMLLGGRACDLECSNAKLKAIVPNFRTTIPLDDGVKMVLDWYRKNDYYQGFDYQWDAQQDRIIAELWPMKVKRGYISYSKCSYVESLAQRCVWELEYNKNRKINYYIWKGIRKFISKPLSKIHQS